MAACAVSPPLEAYPDIIGADGKSRGQRIHWIVRNDLAHIFEMKAGERDAPVISIKR